ncbi:unnamed protein product [Symbiodinium sp. CCMP2592]|nr:unnamed protein product [Symbiodinium sp. CCMP2592]
MADTEQGRQSEETSARSARLQERFRACMGDDSSQRIYTQLDAFRGRLWSEIASAQTGAIVWWTMTSGLSAMIFVWWLGGDHWLTGQWILSAVLLILSAILALGFGPSMPEASAILDAEDVLWCIIIGLLCTCYCFPQMLLAQDLLQNFSEDLAEARGSYQAIFWSCVVAMVAVPIFANWHMIITRAWLSTFRDYRTVAETVIDHKIVTLRPGRLANKAEQQPLVDGKAMAMGDSVDVIQKKIYLGGATDAECTVQTDQPAVLVSDHYGTWAITEQAGESAGMKYEATIRVVAGEKLLIFRGFASPSMPDMLTDLRATSYDVLRKKPHAMWLSKIMIQVKHVAFILSIALLILVLGLTHSTIPSLWDALVGEALPCLIPLPDWVDKPGCINDVMMTVGNSSMPTWGFYDNSTDVQTPANVELYSQGYWTIMSYFVGFAFSSLIYGMLFCSLPLIVMQVWSAGNRLNQLNDLLLVHQWSIGGLKHRQALMLYKLYHLRASISHLDMRNFYELDTYPDFLLQPVDNPAASDTFFWWFRTRAAIFADTSWTLMLVSPLLYVGIIIVIAIVVGTILLEATGGMVFPLVAYTVIDGMFFGAFMLGFMIYGANVNDALSLAGPLLSQLPEVQNVALQDLLAFEGSHTLQLTFLGIPVGTRMVYSYLMALVSYMITILIAVLKSLFVPWIFQFEPQQ